MIVRIARVKVGNRQAPSARQSAHLSAHSDPRNVHENPRPAIAQPGVFALDVSARASRLERAWVKRRQSRPLQRKRARIDV